jgi:Arc/MetJ-type ribon-helix-helix transcriptional regulator
MADSEKITINMSVVDLGKVDLLVEEGFYSNRTDFIRAAIRSELNRHDDMVKQSAVRKSMVVGVLAYDRKDLERNVAAGKRLAVQVIGKLVIADDVPPDLADAAFDSIKVLGVFEANKLVKEALADRIR